MILLRRLPKSFFSWPSRRTLFAPNILQFTPSNLSNATHTAFRPQKLPVKKFSPPPQLIFWGILTLNGLVYLLWSNATSQYQVLGDTSAYIWMRKNFLVNWNNVQQGRIWCLLTACFSHESTTHLLFNAFSYFFMAPPVLAILGPTKFLTLYLGGGIFASITSLTSRIFRGGMPTDSSHGASAAIYAIISFFACLQPRTTFLIFSIIPCPAWVFVTGIFLFDGYSVITNRITQIDSVGHISGLLAGAGYYLLRRSAFRF